MNLTENYLNENNNNGYDYFGNAAEDTLVFFVRDEAAPFAEPADSSDEASADLSEMNMTDLVNMNAENNGHKNNDVTNFDFYEADTTNDDEFEKSFTGASQQKIKSTEIESNIGLKN